MLDIDFDERAKWNDFLGYDRGSRFNCPACSAAEWAVDDRRTLTWQHLHFSEHRAFIQAEVPRGRCGECGKRGCHCEAKGRGKAPWRPGRTRVHEL